MSMSKALLKFTIQLIARPCISVPIRPYSSAPEPDLKTTLRELIPAKRELLKKVKSHAEKVIGEVKIENTLGGMRYARRVLSPEKYV